MRHSILHSLKSLVDNSDSRWGRPFDLFIQLLIAVSLVTFSVETLPDLSERTRHILNQIETATVVVFTVEYILRLAVAENRLGFVFSFFGVVDLLAIAPFYLSTGLDLRSVRALRFFRLFRVFKFARYNKAIRRFHRALMIAKEEIVLFVAAVTLLLYLAAVGIYYFEHDAQPEAFSSVFHCLWWAVVTLTTVGYGDVYPITAGGRVFTGCLLLIGLGLIAVPSGLVASALGRVRELDD